MMPSDLSGQNLGAYQLLGEVGSGGMATVYRAYDRRHDRLVALKVILPHLRHNREFVERFQREGRNAAALRHPHIVPIYDSGILEGYPYLAMEYLEGGSLSDWMDQHQGPFPLRQAAGILSQIGSALDHAHQHGVIHRDVKPSNILLTREGEAQLSDFGIARAVWDSRLTESGARLGTPAYMAPEQARGQETDRRTDIYALGVVLYELATGRPPFRGNTNAVLYQHVHEPPPSPRRLNPQLPREAEGVILKALAKKPKQRYQSATQLATAFQNAVGLASSQMPPQLDLPTPVPSSATPSSTTHTRQNGALIITAVIAIATLVGALTFGLSHSSPTIVPGPTDTAQANPTATNTTLPSPTSRPPTPATPLQLIKPEDGRGFYAYQEVTLSWRGVPLRSDQRFHVELQDTETGQQLPRQLTTGESRYTISRLDVSGYRWRVWMEEDVEGKWETVGQPSEWRTFYIVPPPTATPAPPATSDGSGVDPDEPPQR